MIRIDYGNDGQQIVFRWSCGVCSVDDQAILPSEGIDAVLRHLQRSHERNELTRFNTILTQGMSAATQIISEEASG